jgi:hypothetical protein
LDAKTGGQKSALETADAHRDRKSGDDTGEIPAETAFLESPTKCAVWEDWMVETEGTKLPTPHAVTRTSLWHRSQERKFAQNRPLRLLETDPETLSSVSRIPGVNCGRPSAVVLELARYRI